MSVEPSGRIKLERRNDGKLDLQQERARLMAPKPSWDQYYARLSLDGIKALPEPTDKWTQDREAGAIGGEK